MNLNVNRKAIRKITTLGCVLIIGVGIFIGWRIVDAYLNPMFGYKPKAVLEQLFDNKKTKELFYDGVLYRTPDDEYSLEIVNGHVKAVKRVIIKRYLDDESYTGNEIFDDDIIVDGVIYHTVVLLKDPIVVNEIKVEIEETRKI